MDVRPSPQRKYPGVLQGLLACLIGTSMFLIASEFGWFAQFERSLYDVGVNLKDAPSAEAECVVIAIDSVSLASWERPPFPLSHHLTRHAELVRVLTAAHVRVICFDLLFDRMDSANGADITAFADACKSAGSVVLAAALDETRDNSGGEIVVKHLLLPTPALLGSVAGIGLVDYPVDNDGAIRGGVAAVRFQDSLLLSLSAAALRLAGSSELGRTSRAGPFLIDYSWTSRIRVISYRDAISKPEIMPLLRGKIVFVGSTVAEGNDDYRIPLNSRAGEPRVESGVVIHAAAAQTLLAGTIVEPIQTSHGVILCLLLAGLLVVLGVGRIVWISVAGFVFAAVGLTVAAVLAVPYFALVLPGGKLLLGLSTVLSSQWLLNITRLRNISSSQHAIIDDYRSDMNSARQIQQQLQPAEAPLDERLDIAVRQITCKEVGGDYYDFVDFGNGRVGILIGDVSGKGVSASLIMSNVQAIFREEAPKHESPSAVFSIINTKLNSISMASGRFISLFYGILDSAGLKLIYSNAGHCNPIVCGSTGESRTLTEGGIFLGPLESMQWNDSIEQLSPGDLLCLYTDGVSEAGIDVSNQFGEERILECLTGSANSSQDTLNDLLSNCSDFVHNRSFEDDWTVVIVKVR